MKGTNNVVFLRDKVRNNAKNRIFASTMNIYINEEIEKFDLEDALSHLSSQRYEQVMQFKFEMGRKLCAAAYLLLCKGLREVYGMEELPIFTYGPHGKPSIVGHPEVHFNLSHCPGIVICGLSTHPIGVDVENIRHANDSLIRYTMNEAEACMIMDSVNVDVAFTRLWTMKEALMKQQGTGIDDRIKNILLEPHAPIKTVLNEERGYVYSIACEEIDD